MEPNKTTTKGEIIVNGGMINKDNNRVEMMESNDRPSDGSLILRMTGVMMIPYAVCASGCPSLAPLDARTVAQPMTYGSSPARLLTAR